MKEVLRTNDPVRISYAGALLKDAGIVFDVFDSHTSMLEGSIFAIQKRVMVLDDDAGEARAILAEAGLGPRDG